MQGIHHIEVKNRDATFRFDLFRNITVVRGDSGTGKTTLYEMIADFTRLQESSGVNLSCDKPCVALTDIDWKNQLKGIKDSIVFVDEGADFLKTKDFAGAIRGTDNYYVLFTRESLHDLPYSVEEIYEIKSSGKYHSFQKLFSHDEKHVYSRGKGKRKKNGEFNVLLTEDSRSGYQFFESYFRGKNIHCVSSKSNSGIFGRLKENAGSKALVIADGAAFGSEIDRILKLRSGTEIQLCLPESFEWLILKSGLIKAENLVQILENPSDYIESKDYFSWENFFERYLIQSTIDTPFHYTKRQINKIYLIDGNAKKIVEEIF